MAVFRKNAGWLVLASYLFANTLASSWHNHRDCCGYFDEAQPHTASCALLGDHVHAHGDHAHGDHAHGDHAHGDHAQGLARCQHHDHVRGHDNRRNQDRGQSRDGDDQNAPRHCVVCDFLALAPLAAPPLGLTPAPDVIPQLVALGVVDVASPPIETHLARGPPAP